MHKSVATIDSPEFINLQPLDLNPLMSKCEIKVLYIGANRNRTYISKEVATEIGKNLRGAPIVGYYRDTKEDFTDHGEKIVIDDEGIKFECQTFPYGFVSPDAQVWFQDFEDFDAFGNTVKHTYLMTTGYLWTGIFTESSLPVEEGRPQSMEFFEASVKGKWEENYANGMDFYIVDDAIVQKLCILGDDVEPCFEGASVTAPDASTKFTLDDNFKHTLYNMMQDLKNVLEGERQMDKNFTQAEQTEATASAVEETPVIEFEVEDTQKTSEDTTETGSVISDYSAKEDDKKKEESEDKKEDAPAKEGGDDKENSSDNKDTKEGKEDDDEKKKGEKYSLLESELNTLKAEYQDLQTKYQELVAFKTEIDNQKKDALISEFYMLADEDKADVIQNKEKYTLDEIKAKLSVICFDKKINFSLQQPATREVETEEEAPIMTYALEQTNDSLPDWVKAVKEEMK